MKLTFNVTKENKKAFAKAIGAIDRKSTRLNSSH